MLFLLVMIQCVWLIIQLIYLYSEHYIDRLNVISIRKLYELSEKLGPNEIPRESMNWSSIDERTYKSIHWWQNWSDDTPIANLPIRGTHHSVTYTINNVLSLFAKTQKHSLLQQLNRGVRLFDIRLKSDEKTGKLWAYHDFVDLNLSWTKIWKVFQAWLLSFPAEGILLLIRDETYKNHSSVAARAVKEIDESERVSRILWNNDDFSLIDTLTVGKLRGKVFLLNHSENLALAWADNRNFVVGNVRVGDQYQVANTDEKITLCVRFYDSILNERRRTDTDDETRRVERSSYGRSNYLNLLFTSIANRNPFTSVQSIANTINQEFLSILHERNLPILGCVFVQDWID